MSRKRNQLLDYLKSGRDMRSPTLENMAKNAGYSGNKGVLNALEHLIKKGLVVKTKNGYFVIEESCTCDESDACSNCTERLSLGQILVDVYTDGVEGMPEESAIPSAKAEILKNFIPREEVAALIDEVIESTYNGHTMEEFDGIESFKMIQRTRAKQLLSTMQPGEEE